MADDTFERLKSAISDRYRLDRLIGQGGMATVYLAEDIKHARQVAIKVLRPDLSAALGADRFLREIELAAKLQHPHIVPVYDSGNAGGILYYVMPFVEGESLRELLQREKRVTLDQAAEIVRGAASGLAYAHSHGIVHRDVKPENIMLTGGHAVVTDFGIARAVDASRNVDANLTGVGMAMGTPAYMSPEQATADEIDGRTDQYALACVFYEMISGKQAFSGPTMQAMLASILTAPRPRLVTSVATVPPEVDAATQRALSTDPAKRFPSILDFSKAVGQESSGAAAATRESRRWKRLAFSLPVLVAAIAAVYVTVFAGPKRVVVSGAETMAIVPFTTSGSGLEGMGEGMVDLLSVNLNGVGAIRTIEPRTVIQEWHKRVKEGGSTLEDAIEVGRSSKAASVLTGSIVASGGTTRLTAELYDLDGVSLARTQVSGPSDSVLMLADSLALGLLHEIWRSKDPLPSANSAMITSTSMPAIRAYLRGESFHRRGAWDSALVQFEAAVQEDSTFALAWYRLANTMGWAGQYQSPPMRHAAAMAEKNSQSLPPRPRSLMVAYNLFALGDVSATDSAVAYTRLYPNDVDGWFLLGESQYHTNGYHPLSPADLRAPFDKVLSLDSTLTPAAIHPVELALETADTALLKKYESVFIRGGDSSSLVRLRAARDFLYGRGQALEILATSPLGASSTRGALFGRLSHDGITGDSFAAVAQSMALAKVPDQLRNQFVLAGAALFAGTGRVSKADTVAGFPARASEGGQLVRGMGVILGIAPPSVLDASAAELAATADSLKAIHQESPYLSGLQAIIAYDRGDFAKATAFSRAILNFQPQDQVPKWLRGTATTLDGLALVATGDTLRGMARADSGLRLIGGTNAVPFSPAVQVRYAQVEIARVATRANGINRLRFGFTAAPQYLPANTLRIARAYESAESFDSAAVNYRRFLAYFNAPDALYAPLVEDAKAGLARVTRERSATVPVGKKPN